MGYHRAGFEVVGVDIKPQPRYPFRFIQADALEWLRVMGPTGVDFIHASPPCQAFTKAQRIQDREHPDLIAPTRELLRWVGLPWVLENVPGAPLRNPVTLCGLMFGLDVDRDRLFESSVPIPQPEHPAHDRPKAKMGRPPRPGDIIQVVGHFSGVEYARKAMDIPWMTRDELKEAVPPAMTEFVGRHLLQGTLGLVA